MALQLNKTLTGKVVAPECYARIIESRYGKSLTQPYPESILGIHVTVGFYFNAAARTEDDRQYIESQTYTIIDMTKETRADQYTYLKTLPEFAGAIDV